ncbi:helix-turn-helix domain-containing protein [Novosphingobium sp. G106]|uniref:helix-turn-helix domain-containing protein n=1 Tax=Novosphingobium sp. G106 TaxID=2849500 RepID=UPI0020C53561|nr:helix-turn-helix domain-containing protein [Novosphingobium sp. G106]
MAGSVKHNELAAVSEASVTATQKSGVMILAPDGNVRTLMEIEADLIHLAVSIYGGSVSKAARRLGIGRSTLYRKLDTAQIGSSC